jgi:tetratricopeptide (TPR) repeat protein
MRENVLKLFVCTMVQLALSHVPMPGGFRWERLRCLLAFVAAVFVALAVAPPALTQSQQQTDAHAHYDRGYARQSQGDLDGAIADYDQAIRLEPTYGDAYFNRGLARYDKGDFDGAIADYDQPSRSSRIRQPRRCAKKTKAT